MKIYTKAGDRGFTSLYGGRKLRKDHIQVEAYGTVDELNSNIGLLISHLNSELNTEKDRLLGIQTLLFSCGSMLASTDEKREDVPSITDPDVINLETEIDRMSAKMESLRSFILPGGSKAAGICHVTRSVCRRAERRVITLDDGSGNFELIIKYLNRLSDYFFVLGRLINQESGVKEMIWNSNK